MHWQRLVFTIFLFAIVTNQSLALTQDQCPPVAQVAQAHFTNGIQFMSKVVWGLYTDNFQFNGKPWNVAFITPLKALDKQQAITAGQQLFAQIKLSTPEIDVDGQKIFCIYAQGQTYSVMATTPPWPMVEN